MDSNSINSQEQINQALENDQFEQSESRNLKDESACNTGAAEKVDKKLDGPNRPSV
jgi:hypothetical protein